MASSESENRSSEAGNAKALIYSYSNRIWRAFVGLLPSPDSSLLAKISNLYPIRLTAGFRRRRSGLPLLLHPNAINSSPVAAEASRIFVILEDIREHTLSNLHKIHKSLSFWQARAVETDYQKMWFMVFNRGPRAFIRESFQIIRRLTTDGHPFQSINYSAADTISLKIAILTTLQRCLATFLAQVYLEVNKFGELLIVDPEKSLLSLLVAIDNLFRKLEASISHPCEIYNANNDSLSMESGNSCALLFEKLPNMEHVQTQWTDTEIRDATSLINQNLQRLDSYLSFMLSSCQKPNRMTLYWLRYTCGAVGLSACSLWVLRHSSLMGSSDIDNWIRTAKESTATFWEEHVEQPLISIRDELFETFRKRHKGVMEMEEVQLTANSLHRMLLAFSEQTKGQKLPENLTDQEMMEIVMSREEQGPGFCVGPVDPGLAWSEDPLGSCFCYDVFKVLHPVCCQSLLVSTHLVIKWVISPSISGNLMSAIPQTNLHGAAPNFELLKTLIQKEQDDLQKVTQEAKHHEDNLKFLKSHVNTINESIHHLQGELKECHLSVVAVELNGNITFVNTEKQTFDHIQQLDETAAGVICQVKDQHGSVASTLRCTKDVVGIVASLGKVKDEELSRTLSEYLGLDTMLAIVCKTLEGVQALERYEKDGSIDRNTGLHGIAPTIGRTMKGRFHVFCLQNMRPFVGEFLSDDPQKKLALMNPRLPNGKLPPGFLGFAVNMISVDDMHLSCVTIDGHGLRETLFFNLFSRLQVYKSRADMLCAQPFITDGAVSLDGGMIKSCGLFCLGDRNDVEIKFPMADAKPSIPREVFEIEQQIKFMEWKKEMLSSDIQREESLLNTAKGSLKAKSDGYRMLINEELLNKGRSPSPRPINTGFLMHEARRQ